jgi:hypothetical protein
LGAADFITQRTNGHQVEVSMETHKIFGGGWKRRLVPQQIEFNVKITVEKEQQK